MKDLNLNLNLNLKFIFALSILLCIIFILVKYFNRNLMVNAIDGKKYSVLDLPDKKIAADKLAKINNILSRIILELNIENFNSEKMQRLKYKFKANLTENAPGGRNTSYTLNKGDEIHMCLRQKNDDLIDDNTLLFVALHELSHVMTISIGHTPEFWDNFKFLLNHAIKKGYYRYYPYHLTPKAYCGTKITSSP